MSRGSTRMRGRMAGMRRWDGRSRITTDWFGLHNDTELNFSDGDILVFLHEPGKARRRVSFRLHAEYLATIGFQSLVDQAVVAPTPKHWAMPASPSGELGVTVRELYLPPPNDADRDAIARHNLATRNFFAWLYDRPLAGKTLGASMVDAMTKAYTYRPNHAELNNRDMLAYLDRRGYMDFRECVDHALAVLQLAESCRMESLWVNAFSHCVGMHHSLPASIEYNGVGRVTKAMIIRTRLEMDIRLDRVAKSMTTFFDHDVSGSSPGFGRIAKDHLDRFRSFLHGHYIESHGFWPPSGFAASFALRRSLYSSMYIEFRALYQYLVDTQSNPALPIAKPSQSGISTLQIIRDFDTQCKLDTLPHPLPLLPQPVRHSAPLGFTIKKRRMEREARQKALMKSLGDASNRNPDLMKSRLVRSYSQFEKQTVLDGFDPVDPIEGRKVRWILIYAIFQTLASVISAPKEVTDTDGLSYPLCCQRPTVMPWAVEGDECAAVIPVASRSTESKDDFRNGLQGLSHEPRGDGTMITCQRNVSLTSFTTSLSQVEVHTASSPPSSPSTSAASKSSLAPSLLRPSQKVEESPGDTATISKLTLPTRHKRVSFQQIVPGRCDNRLSQTIGHRTKAPVAPSATGQSDDHRSSAEKVINNRLFMRTATSPPPYENPPSPSNRPPSYVAPRNFTPSLLPFTTSSPPSRPESPTLPSLTSTPSGSRDSSRNSEFGCIASNSSTPSDGKHLDHNSTQNSNTATAASAPIPIPTPKSAEFPKVNEKRVLKPRERPNISAKRSPSSFPSAPRTTAPSKALPQLPSTLALSTVAGPEKYLSLPSVTGSGRIGMPKGLLGSTSNTSSNTSVNVIKAGTETRRSD